MPVSYDQLTDENAALRTRIEELREQLEITSDMLSIEEITTQKLEKKLGELQNLLEESLVWVEYWDTHEPAVKLAHRMRKELGEK